MLIFWLLVKPVYKRAPKNDSHLAIKQVLCVCVLSYKHPGIFVKPIKFLIISLTLFTPMYKMLMFKILLLLTQVVYVEYSHSGTI